MNAHDSFENLLKLFFLLNDQIINDRLIIALDANKIKNDKGN